MEKQPALFKSECRLLSLIVYAILVTDGQTAFKSSLQTIFPS